MVGYGHGVAGDAALKLVVCVSADDAQVERGRWELGSYVSADDAQVERGRWELGSYVSADDA